eukprot:NODE_107_length_18988_cov_0.534491.p7 type:complete len:272 gc:universal NODE_107_length_18988_cov_0.534491:14646-15461(+)
MSQILNNDIVKLEISKRKLSKTQFEEMIKSAPVNLQDVSEMDLKSITSVNELNKFADDEADLDGLDLDEKPLKINNNKINLNQYAENDESFNFSTESISKKKPFLITNYKPKVTITGEAKKEDLDDGLDLNDFDGNLKVPIKNDISIKPILLSKDILTSQKPYNGDRIENLILQTEEIIKIHKSQQENQLKYNDIVTKQKEYFIGCIRQVDKDLNIAFSKLDDLKTRKKNLEAELDKKSNLEKAEDVIFTKLVIFFCIYYNIYCIYNNFFH